MEAPWQLRGQARTRYWIPDGFPEGWRIPRELRYLVIDEFIQDVLTLAVSGWPKIDHDGRLEFPEPTTGVKLRVPALEAFLTAHRQSPPQAPPAEGAEAFRQRPLRLGDAFAAAEALPPGEASRALEPGAVPFVVPDEWLRPPVYDITAAARLAAKLAFYSAAAPAIAPETYVTEAGTAEAASEDEYDLLSAPVESNVIEETPA